MPLHGAHQGDNAVDRAHGRRGVLRRAAGAGRGRRRGSPPSSMPGRFEVLGHQPLVIVDGAHNPAGADTCAQVFFDDFAPGGPADPRRRHAARADGDARGPAGRRVRRGRRLHRPVARGACPARTSPRPPSTLGCDEVLAADTVAEACARRHAHAPTATTPSSPPARSTSPAPPDAALVRLLARSDLGGDLPAMLRAISARSCQTLSGGRREVRRPAGDVAADPLGLPAGACARSPGR